MSKPIAEIQLPSHHPAVAACKPGQHIMVHAQRAPEPDADDMPVGPGGKQGVRPPPLSTRFHVTHMEAGGKVKAPAKKSSPMEYLKAKNTEQAGKA